MQSLQPDPRSFHEDVGADAADWVARPGSWGQIAATLLVVGLLAALNPLLTLLVLVAVGIIYGNGSPNYLIPSIIAVAAAWLAVVNITKEPASDLVEYFARYEQIAGMSLYEVLEVYRHEAAYYALNWLLSRVPGAGPEALVAVTSIFIYLILLASIHVSGKALRADLRVVLAGIVVVAMFPQLFSISAHIIRQAMAGSLVALVVGLYLRDGRFRISLLVLATLFHTAAAAAFLLPVVLLLQRRIRLLQGFVASVVLFVALAVAMRLVAPVLQVFDGTPLAFLAYGAQRATAESFYELTALSLAPIVLLLATLAGTLFFVAFCLSWYEEPVRQRIRFILAFTAVLISGVFAAHWAGVTEISNRFLYFVYQLLGIIFVIFVARLRHREMIAIAPVLVGPLWFLGALRTSQWQYDSVIDLASRPLAEPLIAAVKAMVLY
jgi:hypothetical protein